MKALTICQPYANLIAFGQKRVENRTWPTNYRGRLLIHAGKSREWLDDDGDGMDRRYGLDIAEMPFGAVVAVATLVECASYGRIEMKDFDREYPWLREHEHTEGPWCWILADVERLAKPFPARGALGLFDIPLPGAVQTESR